MIPHPTFVDAVGATGNVLECLLREIERRVDTAGWDQPNSYHLVTFNPLGLMVATLVLPPALGMVHPALLLDELTDSISRDGGCPIPIAGDFAGLAVTVEAWSVSNAATDKAAAARNHADATAGLIHTRPDRREIRWAMVALAAGGEGRLVRDRISDTVVYADGLETGTVPATLRRLVAACQRRVEGAT